MPIIFLTSVEYGVRRVELNLDREIGTSRFQFGTAGKRDGGSRGEFVDTF